MHLFLLKSSLVSPSTQPEKHSTSKHALKKIVQSEQTIKGCKILQTSTTMGLRELSTSNHPRIRDKLPGVLEKSNKFSFTQFLNSQQRDRQPIHAYIKPSDNESDSFESPVKITNSLQCLFRKKNISLTNLRMKVNQSPHTITMQKMANLKKSFALLVIDQINTDIARLKENRILDVEQQRAEMQPSLKHQLEIASFALVRQQFEKLAKSLDRHFGISKIETNLLSGSTIFRNHAFQLIINYYCARIHFYYKNLHKCILLLKATKQYAYMNENFEYSRMKCYQCLGECFMNLRPSNCKAYLTKFLQMSWKLGSCEHELKAYEMMGKYYFYVGDSIKAAFYHERIVDGVLESQNSPMRKLALSKIQNQLSQRQKKDNQKILVIGQTDAEYIISSEEESFDFLMAQAERGEDKIFAHRKKQLQKYQLRTNTTFDTSKDQKTVNLIYKAANVNIRQPKEVERYHQNFFATTANLRSNVSLGKLKDRVLVSHLSPNRELSNYQTLELLTTQNTQKALNQLQLYNENFEMIKIKKLLLKISQLATAIEEQMVFIERGIVQDFQFL